MSDNQDPRQELRANLERYVAGLATSGDNFRVAGEIEPVGQEVRDDYVNSILHLFDRYADQRVAEARNNDGWTIELPDLPYFQIKAFNEERNEWMTPIYYTKNLPASIKVLHQQQTNSQLRREGGK